MVAPCVLAPASRPPGGRGGRRGGTGGPGADGGSPGIFAVNMVPGLSLFGILL